MVQESIMSIVAAAFGRRLRDLRTQKKWSQQHLADELGMGIAQITRYERGLSQPTLEVIKKVATLFRVSADELVFERGTAGAAEAVIKGALLERFEKISHLPDADQRVVLYLLDAVIARADLTALVARQSSPKLAG